MRSLRAINGCPQIWTIFRNTTDSPLLETLWGEVCAKRQTEVAVMISSVLAGTNCLSYRSWIFLAIASALFSVCAWSQTQLATVSGTITDPSGAVVPGAQ